MDDLFDIKFPIENDVKENVILKFSNKQGGAYNIFSYYWQCFVWAAAIGFLRNKRLPLAPGIERIFSLSTMRGNGGEKDAQALICMCIARAGSVDIMEDPSEAIMAISEYANGGFHHIMKLIKNGENTFNDFEKVKQEIFRRDYWNENPSDDTFALEPAPTADDNISSDDYVVPESMDFDDVSVDLEMDEEAIKQAEQDIVAEVAEEEKKIAAKKPARVSKCWTATERAELVKYYKQGMTIDQLAGFFGKSEDNVQDVLSKLKLL